MKIQEKIVTRSPLVKIGVSRQVVIPKKIHEALELVPGDYLEVQLEDNRVVMTPTTPVEKKFQTELEKRLAKGLDDIRRGRAYGPFKSAKEGISFLHRETKRRKRAGIKSA